MTDWTPASHPSEWPPLPAEGGEEQPLKLATEEDLRNAVRFYQQSYNRAIARISTQSGALEGQRRRLAAAAEENGLLRRSNDDKDKALAHSHSALARADEEARQAGIRLLDAESGRSEAVRENDRLRRLLDDMRPERPFIDGESSPHEAARRFLTDCGFYPAPDAIDQLATVFHKCLSIMCSRGYDERGATWQAAGWRGQVFEMRKKLERIWWRSWKNGVIDADSAWDLINYAGFYLRARAWAEPGDGWGRWGEGDGAEPLLPAHDWENAKITVDFPGLPDDGIHSDWKFRDPGEYPPEFNIPSKESVAAARERMRAWVDSAVPWPAHDDPEPLSKSLLDAYKERSAAGRPLFATGGPVHARPPVPVIRQLDHEEGGGEPEFGKSDYDVRNPGEWYTRHNHGPGVLCAPPCRSSSARTRRYHRGPGNAAGSGWG